MKALWSGLAAAALLSCAGSMQYSAWSEVTTPNFVIQTDLDGPEARAVSQSLEEMRAALLTVAWTGGNGPPGRMHVVVFSSVKEFQHRVGRSTAEGIQISRTEAEPTLSFSSSGQLGVPTVVVHELTHALSRWFMPVQPVWLSEGLAGYFEGTSFDSATILASTGRMSERYTQWFKSMRVMVRSSDMFEATTAKYDKPIVMESFYATSWLLVHYLLNEKGEAFEDYQRSLAHLVPPGEAWSSAFPELSPDQLDTEVLAYSKLKRIHVRTAHVNVYEFSPSVRNLSPAEAHGVLARLSAGLAPGVAEQEMLEALKLDPNEVNALLVRFERLEEASDAERLEVARRAVAAHPESGEAWLLAARAEPSGEAQRAALARAHTLAPDHPGVAMLMARQELEEGDAGKALEYSALALRRSPLTPSLLALYVRALGTRGNCAKARAIADDAPALFPEPCQVHTADGKQLACHVLVQRAWRSVKTRCQ
jgi:hypothetical protein